MKQPLLILITIILFTSCSTNRELSSYVLSDGIYKSDLFSQNKQKVYLDNNEDTLSVYLIDKDKKTATRIPSQKQTFPQSISNDALTAHSFNKQA